MTRRPSPTGSPLSARTGPVAVRSTGRTPRVCRRSPAASPTILSRDRWNRGLAVLTASFNADLVVLAGFMKLVGPVFLAAFPDRVVNAHPSLLPAFPGMHAPADALSHGVKLTGCTVFLVDGGVDAGPIVAQRAVPVHDDDDVAALHERIKVAERTLLVEVVSALTSAPYAVAGRKVRVG